MELFLTGLFFGLVMGVVFMRLHYTGKELENSEAVDRLIEQQDEIIKLQRAKIQRLQKGGKA